MIEFDTTFYTTTLREAVYLTIYNGDDAVSMDDIEAAVDQPHKDGEIGTVTSRLCGKGIITEVPYTDPIAFVPVNRGPEGITWVKNSVKLHITG